MTINVDKQIRIVQFWKLWGSFRILKFGDVSIYLIRAQKVGSSDQCFMTCSEELFSHNLVMSISH